MTEAHRRVDVGGRRVDHALEPTGRVGVHRRRVRRVAGQHRPRERRRGFVGGEQVLGDLARGALATGRLQQCRCSPVEHPPLRERQLGPCRFAYQRVGEREAAIGQHPHHSGVGGGGEVVEHFVALGVERRRQQCRIDLLPQFGRCDHHPVRPLRQPGEPPRQHRAHALRHDRPPLLAIGLLGAGAQQPIDLDDEERVAAGVRPHRVDELRVVGRHQFGHRLPIEAGQVDHEVRPRERIEFTTAHGRHHDDAVLDRVRTEEVEERERLGVGPLQVVEHDRRRVRPMRLDDRPGQGVEHAEPVDTRTSTRGRPRSAGRRSWSTGPAMRRAAPGSTSTSAGRRHLRGLATTRLRHPPARAPPRPGRSCRHRDRRRSSPPPLARHGTDRTSSPTPRARRHDPRTGSSKPHHHHAPSRCVAVPPAARVHTSS